MCRIGVFPPGTTKISALRMMYRQRGSNSDGIGSVYVKDGKFVVNKTEKSISDAVKAGIPIFDHMPHDGWTIVHLRAASIGDVTVENAHPFVKGSWAVAHNGGWHLHEMLRALSGDIGLQGSTDSEVAAHFISKCGPKVFRKYCVGSGIFACLNELGQLWVIKDGCSLHMHDNDQGQTIFTTEAVNKDCAVFDDGIIGLGPDMDVLYWEDARPYRHSSNYGNVTRTVVTPDSIGNRDTGWDMSRNRQLPRWITELQKKPGEEIEWGTEYYEEKETGTIYTAEEWESEHGYLGLALQAGLLKPYAIEDALCEEQEAAVQGLWLPEKYTSEKFKTEDQSAFEIAKEKERVLKERADAGYDW